MMLYHDIFCCFTISFTTLWTNSADDKWRELAWNVKSCFLGKIRKLFQSVVCWKLYPICLALSQQKQISIVSNDVLDIYIFVFSFIFIFLPNSLDSSCQVSILYKSIAGRYWPVSYPDGPITARYRFIKNAYWVGTFVLESAVTGRLTYKASYKICRRHSQIFK